MAAADIDANHCLLTEVIHAAQTHHVEVEELDPAEHGVPKLADDHLERERHAVDNDSDSAARNKIRRRVSDATAFAVVIRVGQALQFHLGADR